MLKCLVSALVLGCALALTDQELAQFKSKGTAESNTGISGLVTVSESGNNHVITTNNIPDHATGVFPAKSNPNSIVEKTTTYNIPKNPTVASSPSCLNMGSIGVAVNGVAIFSPFDADGENAVEGPGAEVFDDCDGHPSPQGIYHYHQLPDCLVDNTPDQLIGVAKDGFPIYSSIDENGQELTAADLDECNGRYVNGNYRYHTTRTWPYIMGCYRGSVRMGGNSNMCFFAKNTAAPPTVAAVTSSNLQTTTASATSCRCRKPCCTDGETPTGGRPPLRPHQLSPSCCNIGCRLCSNLAIGK